MSEDTKPELDGILVLPPLGYVEFMENMTRPAKPSDLMERAAKLHRAIAKQRKP